MIQKKKLLKKKTDELHALYVQQHVACESFKYYLRNKWKSCLGKLKQLK